MAESSLNGQKTLWEKEKLLVSSNFSFSHSVFQIIVLQTCKSQGLFGKECYICVCVCVCVCALFCLREIEFKVPIAAIEKDVC